MKRRWILRGVMLMLLAVVAVGLFGLAVQGLWNWLVPDLFGWKPLGFVQALGLLALCRILFGGLRGGPGRHAHWRRRIRARWEQMTPEERQRFRAGLGGGCGGRMPDPQAKPV